MIVDDCLYEKLLNIAWKEKNEIIEHSLGYFCTQGISE